LKAHSDAVIVFISKSSITKSGYVQKEIKFALDIAVKNPEGTTPSFPRGSKNTNYQTDSPHFTVLTCGSRTVSI